MEKLKVDLDHLVVASFETEPPRAGREGTVRGYHTGVETCQPCTDWDTCGGTCYWTPCC